MDNPNATLGQDITFTCDVPPEIPDFNIQWPDFSIRGGRTFSLPSLGREDDGGYSCSYTNRSGAADYNFKTRNSKTFYLICKSTNKCLSFIYSYAKSSKELKGCQQKLKQ